MARKTDPFYEDLLNQQIREAVNNDFGRAVLKLSADDPESVRDEVFIYFSATAMQQVNALATKYGIEDPAALHELYQMCRINLIQGFRIGQKVGSSWLPS